MDKTQVKQTYEVFSKLQFVALNKYIKGMQLLYIALITNQWWIFTNRRKNSLCCLVSLPFCMGIYLARVSMSLGLTSVLYGHICCPSFLSLSLTSVLYGYICCWVSMSLRLTSVLFGYLCCTSFYVAWSHFRSVDCHS
jgi:hypothetical protein